MKTLLIITAYIAPFLFIPAVFKWSGSVLGNLSGMMNNRTKGVFDRNRNFRSNTRKRNFSNAATDNRFTSGKLLGSKKLGGLANKGVGGAFLGAGVIASGQGSFRPKKMAQKIAIARNYASEGEVEKVSNSIATQWQGNDPMVRAAKFFKREQIRRSLENEDEGKAESEWAFKGDANKVQTERAIEQIMAAQRGVSESGFQKARQRMMVKTGTGYQVDRYSDESGEAISGEAYTARRNSFVNEETGVFDYEGFAATGYKKTTEFNAEEMLRDINTAYGDDRMGAGKAVAEAKGNLLSSGQIAGQASFGTWKTQLDNMWRTGADSDGVVSRGYDTNGKKIIGDAAARAREDPTSVIMKDAIASAPPSYYQSMKPASVETAARYHAERIQDLAKSAATGTVMKFEGGVERAATAADVATATAAAKQLLESMNAVSPQIAAKFAATLMAAPIAELDSLRPKTTVTEAEKDAEGNDVIGEDGKIVYTTRVIPGRAPTTVRELVDIVPQLDPSINTGYHETRFEWQSGIAERMADEARRAASSGPPGSGPPTGIPPAMPSGR